MNGTKAGVLTWAFLETLRARLPLNHTSSPDHYA